MNKKVLFKKVATAAQYIGQSINRYAYPPVEIKVEIPFPGLPTNPDTVVLSSNAKSVRLRYDRRDKKWSLWRPTAIDFTTEATYKKGKVHVDKYMYANHSMKELEPYFVKQVENQYGKVSVIRLEMHISQLTGRPSLTTEPAAA